jgi:hypothetical protein
VGLTKEEKAQLDALTKKSKEPDPPTPSVNYTLDLGSDAAWERAKQLGLVNDPEPNGDDGDDDDADNDDPPKRPGYFGGQ